jgi:hypothetical protein
MLRYYRDPDGTQVLSSNDNTLASQTGIGKLPKLDSFDMDGLKQRVKELEDLLNKHNVNDCIAIVRLFINKIIYSYRFLGISVKTFDYLN